MPEAPGPALTVSVVGGNGLARDVAVRALTDSGLDITDAPPAGDGGGKPEEPRVTVLVDPDRGHWEMIDLAGSAVVVVSGRRYDDGAVVEAIRRGAGAVLDAASDPTLMAKAVEVVAGGGVLLGPAHTRALAEAVRREPPQAEAGVVLTRREVDILRSVDKGDSVKQTALALGISRKTVENLQGRMFRKLGVRNRAQAVARVLALGVLTDPE